MIRSTALCVTCRQALTVSHGTDPLTLQCERQCQGCRSRPEPKRRPRRPALAFPRPMGVEEAQA